MATAFIKPPKSFDFKAHREVQDQIANALDTPALSAIEVNLIGTDYMDSSALGLLLVLRDKAARLGINTIILSHAHGAVAEILKIARFEKIFTLK